MSQVELEDVDADAGDVNAPERGMNRSATEFMQ